MKKNVENYFEHFVDEYADEIVAIQPVFYKNAAKFIDSAILNLNRKCKVLDIGNGGVINYQYSKIDELVCVDLSISQKVIEQYREVTSIHFQRGNMLDLEHIEDGTFDAVIVQTVIHHLAGKNLEETEKNVEQGIKECMRVLKKGGKILIVESTVLPWFEKIERFFYPIMQLFFRIIKFDMVYQYSFNNLLRKIREMDMCVEEHSVIELDKYIWLCRKKVLTKITPCCACWILIQK